MKTAFKTAMCIMPLFCKFANAQVPCEFKTLYKGSSVYENSVGYKILEAKNNDFLLLGHAKLPVTGYGSISLELTRIDRCGTKLWAVTHDSANCIKFPCAGIVDLIEYPDENIIYAAYYSGVNIKDRGIRIIKTDKNGSLKWKFKVGDTSQYYTLNRFIKINSGHFLLSGYLTNNKNRACAIIADTFGNTLFQKTYNIDTSSQSVFTSAYWKSENEITLLGYEDSALFIVNIDTLGNTISEQKISKAIGGFKEIGTLVMNYDSSEMFLVGNKYDGSKYLYLYIARLNKLGIVTNAINFSNLAGRFLSVLPNNQVLLADYKGVFLLDSTFNIIRKDTTNNSKVISIILFYHGILSKDKALLYIGSDYYSSGFGTYFNTLVTKMYVFKYVKSISIMGPNIIDQKEGQIQLSANIFPADAANKNVKWQVNNTNIAVIDTTGILSARYNGNVIVTASALDGSAVSATKSITIIYQNVGIDEMKVSSIFIYPNPASEYITIDAGNLIIKSIVIKDMSGKQLSLLKANFIDLKSYTSGLYIIKIETDKGTLFKKLIINR